MKNALCETKNGWLQNSLLIMQSSYFWLLVPCLTYCTSSPLKISSIVMQSALTQSWYVGLQNHISDFSNTASFFISNLITKWQDIIFPDSLRTMWIFCKLKPKQTIWDSFWRPTLISMSAKFQSDSMYCEGDGVRKWSGIALVFYFEKNVVKIHHFRKETPGVL